MRIFTSKQFGHWASSEGISDSNLRISAKEAFAGQVEADLGGYLFKKRIARSGGGKSGGYRTILGFRKSNADRIFFLYGFPKNARANISSKEQEALRTVAGGLVNASDTQVEALKSKGSILELECGE